MTIVKRTMLDQVELTRGGDVRVRVALELVEGPEILGTKYHRISINFNEDLLAQMAAVNQDLAGMGYPAVPAGALQLLLNGQALILQYLAATGQTPSGPSPLS